MSNSRFAREARPQLPGELVDDGSFQCCVRIGRSCLLCGKKSSHFPYTWFVSAIPILSSRYPLYTASLHILFSSGHSLTFEQVGPDWYCMCVTYTLIIVPTVLFIRNVAIYYGAPVIVIAVILCAVTLGYDCNRFNTMLNCLSPCSLSLRI